MKRDRNNAQFWEKEMQNVSYKPCKKILKLVKKYPKI